jgi:hypothetical protein
MIFLCLFKIVPSIFLVCLLAMFFVIDPSSIFLRLSSKKLELLALAASLGCPPPDFSFSACYSLNFFTNASISAI